MEPPPILFDDETTLVLDKPPGLPVAASRPGESCLNTLVRERFGREVRAVHKLDPEAGGPVVYARTKPALDFLSGQFQSKTAGVLWSALVTVTPVAGAARPDRLVRDEHGLPPEACVLDWPLMEDPLKPGLWRIGRRQEARATATGVRRLELFGRFALLECAAPVAPLHQVRVHLAAAGLPVLNDPDYGPSGLELRLSDLKRGYKGLADERPLIRGLALHLARLTLRHPGTREPLEVESSPPREFEVALKNLRKFAARGLDRPAG
ncbi:MAG: pseudouridine synthase [Verrucomicrobiota bacterium]